MGSSAETIGSHPFSEVVLIEVEELRRQYGDLVAVDNVSFEAKAGEIFGLLGPNGAGKTTTIGCISGLLKPDAGTIRVLGHNVVSDGRSSREKLGVVPQEIALYEDLSAHENLTYWGSAYGLRGGELNRCVGEFLDVRGLQDRASDRVKKFSGGMKRRLNFACGIVHEPRALLLDEPTVGVDPQSRVRLLELVREQTRRGTCVLYTIHYMEEAESLCDRLAIIDHGRIIAAGTLGELRSMLSERDLLRFTGTFHPTSVRDSLLGQDIDIVQCEEGFVTLAVLEASKRLPAIFEALSFAGSEIRETTRAQPSLEALFIKLTGKALRE